MKLTPIQDKILQTLAESDLAKRFYWTGGTLLSSYYLHHRLSFDLDFFSELPFSHDELIPFLNKLRDELHLDYLEEAHIYDRWEYVVSRTTPETRFEFVYYNHEKKRLAPLTEYKGLLIDSLPDLAANKVMAYIDRNQPKDLLDVYFLLKKRKFTAKKILRLLEQKFGVRIDEFQFWTESSKSLKRLNDLRPYLLEESSVKQDKLFEDIKYFFLDHGRDFLTKQLG